MAPTKVSQSGKAAVSKPRVLVVDDEADLLEVIADTVGKKLNCRLVTAKNVAQARKVLETQKIDLLLTDVNLPDGDGMMLLSVLHLHQPQADAIVMTGQANMDEAIEAMREGASDFVPKPFNSTELTERVWKQYAVDTVYRFLPNEEMFVGVRYNKATGTLAGVTGDAGANRWQVGAGWFITPNLLAKAEYVNQEYFGYPVANIRSGGKFNGMMLEGVVGF